MEANYWVYILECADKHYYIGYTDNLSKRLAKHNQGKGAAYTAARRPVKLVYSEAHETKSSAMRRECELKGWSRAKKEALVKGDMASDEVSHECPQG